MPLMKARLKISQYNQQRKDKVSHRDRKMAMAALSLTSMVDMFAILVIFLLTNSSTVTQWIELGHSIQLPKAKSFENPQKAATLQISTSDVFADEKQLTTLDKIQKGPMIIASLRDWLTQQDKKDAMVNLVAHEQVPFGVMKKIVATCQQAGFTNVNLAISPSSN